VCRCPLERRDFSSGHPSSIETSIELICKAVLNKRLESQASRRRIVPRGTISSRTETHPARARNVDLDGEPQNCSTWNNFEGSVVKDVVRPKAAPAWTASPHVEQFHRLQF
jgi:hypothetical protein